MYIRFSDDITYFGFTKMTIRRFRIKNKLCKVHKLQFMHEKINKTYSLFPVKRQRRVRQTCFMTDVKTRRQLILRHKNKLKGTV